MSDIKFCSDCSNIMHLYIRDNEEKTILYVCKSCSHEESIEEQSLCVYNYDNSKIKRSDLLNTNEYLLHDVTLPKIEKNQNVKCVNPNCTEDSSVTYIKYDTTDMKYLYICNHCGEKWEN